MVAAAVIQVPEVALRVEAGVSRVAVVVSRAAAMLKVVMLKVAEVGVNSVVGVVS